jgi:hypothetical protein
VSKADPAVDKLEIVYLEAVFQRSQSTVPNIVTKNETLLLSLSDKKIYCHSLPDFQKREVLLEDDILDFESYIKKVNLDD